MVYELKILKFKQKNTDLFFLEKQKKVRNANSQILKFSWATILQLKNSV